MDKQKIKTNQVLTWDRLMINFRQTRDYAGIRPGFNMEQ